MDKLAPEDPPQAGGYRLLARLGSGGLGRVYLARSPHGHTVALKLVRRELAGQDAFRARFRHEVAAARRVTGTWAVPVLDADTEADQPWLASEYVAGPTLQSVVAGSGPGHGPLPERSVRLLAVGLAHALQEIEAAGLIHRDLKPSNILITAGRPRLADHGIAQALETAVDAGLRLTGAMVGSPGFMSPEQVRGERATAAADVFGLGCVLAYTATGRLPFGATDSSSHALLRSITSEEPDISGMPDGLAVLVRDCLRKDPAHRPTAQQVVQQAGPGYADTESWLPAEVLGYLGHHAVVGQGGQQGTPGAQPATAVLPGLPALQQPPVGQAAPGQFAGAPAQLPGSGASQPGVPVVLPVQSAAPGAHQAPAAGSQDTGPSLTTQGYSAVLPGAAQPPAARISGAEPPGTPGPGGPVAQPGPGTPAGYPTAGQAQPDAAARTSSVARPPARPVPPPAPGSTAQTSAQSPAGPAASGPSVPGSAAYPRPGGAYPGAAPLPGAPGAWPPLGPGPADAQYGYGYPQAPAAPAGPAGTQASQTGQPGRPGQYGHQGPYGEPGQYGQHGQYGQLGAQEQQEQSQQGQQGQYGPQGRYAEPGQYDRQGQYGQQAQQPQAGPSPYPAAHQAGAAPLPPAQEQPSATAGPQPGSPAYAYPYTGWTPQGPAPQGPAPDATETLARVPAPQVDAEATSVLPPLPFGFGQDDGGSPPTTRQQPENGPGPEDRSSRGRTVLAVGAVVVALAAGGIAYALMGSGSSGTQAAHAAHTPAAATAGSSNPAQAPSPTASAPTPSSSPSPSPDGDVPTSYLGTWSGQVDTDAGESRRVLKIAQGKVGDPVLTLTADGPGGKGGGYHCVFTAALSSAPQPGAPLQIGPSKVTVGQPISSCSPGAPTTLTIGADGTLRRVSTTGETVTYSKSQ